MPITPFTTTDKAPPDAQITQRRRCSPCPLRVPILYYRNPGECINNFTASKIIKHKKNVTINNRLIPNKLPMSSESRITLTPVNNQFLSKINSNTTLYRSIEYPVSPDPRYEPITNQLSCPWKRAIHLLDKSTYNVFSTELKKIIAFNSKISIPQGLIRGDTPVQGFYK